MDVESDIRAASRILSGSRIEVPLSLEEGTPNLSLYCYLAQLLNLRERCVAAVTGSLVFDPTSGNIQAETIVLITNSDKHTNQKDAKFESWEFKDLSANGGLEVNYVKGLK